MNTERIKEIQQDPAYPNSKSVQQALLQVWHECSQEQIKPMTHTDKQPETVYTPFDLNSEIKFSLWGKKHENVYIFTHEELEALLQKEREADQWISVKDKLPEIDIDDNWNKKTGQSKDVWTYSDFGMKKGRYFHHGEHSIWRIDGASSTNGIEVTHWMPLPQPPKK